MLPKIVPLHSVWLRPAKRLGTHDLDHLEVGSLLFSVRMSHVCLFAG